jgi:transposase
MRLKPRGSADVERTCPSWITRDEIASLRREVARRDEQITTLQSALAEATRDLKTLKAQLERMLRQRCGPKSEKLDPRQLALFLQGEPVEERDETPPVASEAPDAESPDDRLKARHRKAPHIDRAKYAGLPRGRVVHEIPESERIDSLTGTRLVPVGSTITEELEYQPARLFIVEHERVLYGLEQQERAERRVEPVLAPMPPRPIDEGLAGPGLLARILVAKYVDHLPLHRQQAIFAREGLEISRKTMCGWVMRCAWLLGPIVQAMRREILACPILQCDDTTILCQENSKGAGRRTAFLWTYLTPALPDVVFDFTLGRGHEVVDAWLESGRTQILLGDGYSGFGTVCRKRGLLEAGCWMHARRKFHDALGESPAAAALVLTLIRELYAVEDEARGLDAEQRRAVRQERSAATLKEIQGALELIRPQHSEGGTMAAAVKYLDGQWDTLVRFRDDGRIPIDNIACEQAIRPVPLGRRNWRFTGSPRGGEAAAVAYSIVMSCKRAGVEPFEYLSDVLVRVCTHPASRIDELIPRRWRELRERGELQPLPR